MDLKRFHGVVPQSVECLLIALRPVLLFSGRRLDLARVVETIAAHDKP